MKTLAAMALIVASALSADAPVKVERETQEIEGWKVRVDVALLTGKDAEVGRKALRVLGYKLSEIAAVVPEEALSKLRQVTLVLDARHPLTSCQYHPSVEWLKEHGYEPELARCVHIPRAKELTGRLPVDQQPMVVLHELAHAYHDQVFGFDDAKIKTAYLRFKEAGKFDKVLHVSGNKVKNYALTNPMEFFAEMSEAFFGTNDFYPFVRAELKQELPDVDELLAEVWGLKEKRK